MDEVLRRCRGEDHYVFAVVQGGAVKIRHDVKLPGKDSFEKALMPGFHSILCFLVIGETEQGFKHDFND